MMTGLHISSLVVIALVLIVAVLLSYRLALTRLRNRINEARDGLLLPVTVPSVIPPYVRGLLEDYNQTNSQLTKIFKTLEECQGRVLKEHDTTDAILQSLSCMLLTVTDDLNISTANHLAKKMFSDNDDALIGVNLFDLVHFNESDRNILRDSFLYKKPINNLEIKLVINSIPRWYSLNLAFISKKEEDIGAIITLQDITEYRELQETLAAREKLVAMGQLAAGIAHELNTPLGSILGFTQLMKKKLDNEEVLEYVSIVEEETRRCSGIINDLLSFARQEACNAGTCDINQLLTGMSEAFLKCRTQRYGIEISLKLQPELPPVEGDCGHLEIVFSNLIINAIQCLEGIEAPRITAHSWLGNDYVYVSIEDNGPGVPEDIRRNIFNPFFTTRDVGSGSGLGLSIVHTLLSKRGAFIKYDSSYLDGARFIVGLPFVDLDRGTA